MKIKKGTKLRDRRQQTNCCCRKDGQVAHRLRRYQATSNNSTFVPNSSRNTSEKTRANDGREASERGQNARVGWTAAVSRRAFANVAHFGERALARGTLMDRNRASLKGARAFNSPSAKNDGTRYRRLFVSICAFYARNTGDNYNRRMRNITTAPIFVANMRKIIFRYGDAQTRKCRVNKRQMIAKKEARVRARASLHKRATFRFSRLALNDALQASGGSRPHEPCGIQFGRRASVSTGAY